MNETLPSIKMYYLRGKKKTKTVGQMEWNTSSKKEEK